MYFFSSLKRELSLRSYHLQTKNLAIKVACHEGATTATFSSLKFPPSQPHTPLLPLCSPFFGGRCRVNERHTQENRVTRCHWIRFLPPPCGVRRAAGRQALGAESLRALIKRWAGHRQRHDTNDAINNPPRTRRHTLVSTAERREEETWRVTVPSAGIAGKARSY